jgi:hypothetical protein
MVAPPMSCETIGEEDVTDPRGVPPAICKARPAIVDSTRTPRFGLVAKYCPLLDAKAQSLQQAGPP